MKAKVNKKWWQFWLPQHLDIQDPEFDGLSDLVDDGTTSAEYGGMSPAKTGTVNRMLNSSKGAAIEADEAEPWYGGDAVEDEDSSVVTAEPPVVYANRGNARMEERKQARERQQQE